jgi:UDP-N-acetylglucosamine--N-acetylmuramyl-(pentapeptide) pyrophosphoryl-undecaprenol N-acetylglucosamine transferase
MAEGSFFFAGGGTGGHIYPAMAVAEQLLKLAPAAKVHFFCSQRDIDSSILAKTPYEFTRLPAVGLEASARGVIRFCKGFRASKKSAKKLIGESEKTVVVGVGGFVAAPVCYAGKKLGRPVKLINTDSVPGKANRLAARWADEVFVQFAETARYFRGTKVTVTGCPLREAFSNPDAQKVRKQLGLDEGKKILLITGASSGSASINEAVCMLVDRLAQFADAWQVVHLTGQGNLENVRAKYVGASISHKILDYWDEMAGLLASADLVIGRSGAVSVAEYAAAGVPAVCLPYPHHKDRHQYLNARALLDAGASVIVDDVPDAAHRAERLWEQLKTLMSDDNRRAAMKRGCKSVGASDAALQIALRLIAAAAP